MKLRRLFWLALAVIGYPSIGLAVTADSKITEVTVYLDRAVVTRQAEIAVPAGQSEVVIDRLPQALSADTLQVTAAAAVEVTVLDVSSARTFVPFAVDPRIDQLDREINDLAQQRRVLADQTSQIKLQREMLDRYQQVVFSDHRATAPTPEEVTKLMDFETQSAAKLADQQRKLDADDAALERRALALQMQRNGLDRPEKAQSFTAVTVRLTAPTPTTVRLLLSYGVPNAQWSPGYEVRATSPDPHVSIAYFGTVRQQTGEDWSGVKMSLSTAQPALRGSPGQLRPWIVGVPVPQPVAMPMVRGGQMLSMMQDSPETVQMDAFAVTGSNAVASVKRSVTSSTFAIELPVTVPSDDRPEKEPIATLQLANRLDYLAIPKNSPAVYLTGHVVNTSEYVLLPGSASVFLNGNFVATDRLETVLPGEKFDVALGADERVTIKRKLQRRGDDEPGLINKRNRTTYDYLITLENHESSEVTVVVKDQVPVSRSDKVVVKVLEPDSDQIKPDSDGIVQWTVKLPAGGKREIPLKFTVEAPAGTQIYGLE